MGRLRFVRISGWLQRLGLAKKPAPALVCREVVELVTRYLEGAMPADERARFEAHIGVCPNCALYLEQFRQTIAATGRLREADVAPEAKEALLSAFREWKRS